ncbi:MAG: PilZ domain-containing protein [Nitrospirae bacterium]|nr:MAG: PilZ domain-containing protein [Nitrospirota bacterium]
MVFYNAPCRKGRPLVGEIHCFKYEKFLYGDEELKERRKSERIILNGRIGGRVIYTHEMRVQDLSLTGVRIKTDKGIPPGHRCNLSLEYKGNKVALKGTVVRSTLVGMRKKEDEFIPVYDIAVAFDEMSDSAKEKLTALIKSLEDEKGP